jgi:hypothetical protein
VPPQEASPVPIPAAALPERSEAGGEVARERSHKTQEVESMAARKVLVGLAVLALSASMTPSVAAAFSPCGHHACKDEVAASGLGRRARSACTRRLMADCRAGVCSCTGESPPCSCAPTTTTTLPCSVCFVTVTDQCLGPCSTDFDCGTEPNVLCLPVAELQRIGVCQATTPLCPPEACQCP